MKSKGFKMVVGLLVVVIVVLGGLVAVKSMGLTSEGVAASGGKVVAAGAVADDAGLPLPSEGVEAIDGSGDGEAA